MMLLFFFFKQKTAYELRISDWSSDVCSSDLADARPDVAVRLGRGEHRVPFALARRDVDHRRHTARTGACQHRVLLLGKSLVVEVTVRIDEHQATVRSEEHTSELQSLMRISYAVFCLKKKT